LNHGALFGMRFETRFDVSDGGFVVAIRELETVALDETDFTGSEQLVHLGGQRAFLFFVQAEEPAESEFAGGAIIRLAQFGEQSITKSHVKLAAPRTGRALGLAKRIGMSSAGR